MSSAVLASSAKRAATLGSEARELSSSNCPRRISLICAAFLLINGCPFYFAGQQPAHRADDAVIGHQPLELLAGVLAAAIGMMQHVQIVSQKTTEATRSEVHHHLVVLQSLPAPYRTQIPDADCHLQVV